MAGWGKASTLFLPYAFRLDAELPEMMVRVFVQ